MTLHTSELDGFVKAVRTVSCNFGDPDLVDCYGPFDLVFDTVVDQTLSPFSDAYLQQQLSLYREIAGRELDQGEGELHPIDAERLLLTPNPIGLIDVHHIGEHVRCLSTMLDLAALTGSPHVLDMGAGHGVSSEVFAFTGCQVHAVDIDPVLGELSRRRAAVRGYTITRSDANFDDLGFLEDGKYEAAFFFQSLHHCIKPWDLITKVKQKLTPNGLIGFAGEPIQNLWWQSWGLRLDPESLYVARGHGWFESGWSREFITECFRRNDMVLDFFPGGHGGGEIGIATMAETKRAQVHAKAQINNSRLPTSEVTLSGKRFASLTGAPATVFGRPGFRQRVGAEGILLYGPYITLEPGTYEVSLIITCLPAQDTSDMDGAMVIDVATKFGELIVWSETFIASTLGQPLLIIRRFTLAEAAVNIEIRARHTGQATWSASLPTLQKL